MKRSATVMASGLATFWEATLIDLPAAMLPMAGNGGAPALERAGWKAYDSWISLANESANRLYENRVFAQASMQALEAFFLGQSMMSELGRVASGKGFSHSAREMSLTQLESVPASVEVQGGQEFPPTGVSVGQRRRASRNGHPVRASHVSTEAKRSAG